MKIVEWKAKGTIDNTPGMMIRVTVDEALSLISSLALQILSKNPNNNRVEFYADKNNKQTYLSIAVTTELT